MNYYKRHLGDYAKDTGWLTTYQHGVYALLLDWYYANERAIPVDLVPRIVKARSGPEKRATNEVLLAFFDLNKHAGFAHSKHADLVIAKYKSKSETNSLIAQEREATKRAQSVRQSCESGEPSHKPLAISHKEANNPSGCLPAEAGATTPPCPHQDIIALYHELLPTNPRVKTWGDARASNLRARWREEGKRQSLDYWRRFFTHVAASEFLTGRREDRGGRPFLPGLDWMILPQNFAKIIENRYHDGAQA